MKSPSTHFVVITCRHLQQDKFSSTVREIISPSTVVIPVSLYDKRNPLLLLDYSSKSYDQRSTVWCIKYHYSTKDVSIYCTMHPVSLYGK